VAKGVSRPPCLAEIGSALDRRENLLKSVQHLDGRPSAARRCASKVLTDRASRHPPPAANSSRRNRQNAALRGGVVDLRDSTTRCKRCRARIFSGDALTDQKRLSCAEHFHVPTRPGSNAMRELFWRNLTGNHAPEGTSRLTGVHPRRFPRFRRDPVFPRASPDHGDPAKKRPCAHALRAPLAGTNSSFPTPRPFTSAEVLKGDRPRSPSLTSTGSYNNRGRPRLPRAPQPRGCTASIFPAAQHNLGPASLRVFAATTGPRKPAPPAPPPRHVDRVGGAAPPKARATSTDLRISPSNRAARRLVFRDG